MNNKSNQFLDYDVNLLVIGGGINGSGIARDAAGRGLKVILCEKKDLACATSSASSKLIHGGLRYLENYEFRLVREALSERDVLLNNALHIVRPLRFVLPCTNNLRPSWMIKIGMFLYDNLAKRSDKLPKSKKIDLKKSPQGIPLKPYIKTGFEYSDSQVDDSRLVILNALDAKERGAKIFTRTSCTKIEQNNGKWLVELKNQYGKKYIVRTRILINATGPWVESLYKLIKFDYLKKRKNKLKMVKGSHFTVPRLYKGDWAYILQNTDGRIVFVIPYQDIYSLIGTTDVIYKNDPYKINISNEEINYLCNTVNRYFINKIGYKDITWSYSGVRPLYNDNSNNISSITRDYVFEILGGKKNEPIMLSIFGGKITTYRKLAEHALKKLSKFTNKPINWTKKSPLPGGNIPGLDINSFIKKNLIKYSWLPKNLVCRYINIYGDRIVNILDKSHSIKDLGEDFGFGIFERELQWLIKYEWARSSCDILWRRTRMGLFINEETKKK